jgi:toxin ParE1/3/4
MKYKVEITGEAEQDILDLHHYIARHDSVQNADHVFNRLEELCLSLSEQPHRGHVPPELGSIGIKEYLEVHFKPYRVIFQITGKTVYIHCVVDGRRDMRTFLERRIFR